MRKWGEGETFDIPIFIPITPQDPFLVVPFKFLPSADPGPGGYAGAKQVQDHLPFSLQLLAPEGVVPVRAILGKTVPQFPVLRSCR